MAVGDYATSQRCDRPATRLRLRYPEHWASEAERATTEDCLRASGLPYEFAFPGAAFGGEGFWVDLLVATSGTVGGAAIWAGLVATFKGLRKLFSRGQLVVEAADRPTVTYIFPEGADDWVAAVQAIADDYQHYVEGEVTSRTWSPDGMVWEVTWRWKEGQHGAGQQAPD